jgi:predicted CXXCH cytochrome family protein
MNKRVLLCLVALSAAFSLLWLSDAPAIDPPHKYESVNKLSCDKCHTVNQAPGGGLISNSVNADLCIGCHSNAELASALPFSDDMQANPGVEGTSHAWNATMPTLSSPSNQYGLRNTDDLDSPVLRAFLETYNDVVTCSVCHAVHIQKYGPWDAFSNSTYTAGVANNRHMMRVTNDYNAMCRDCHYYRDSSQYADPTDESVADGTTVFSHSVNVVASTAPLDATGAAQTNSASPLLANRYAGDVDGNPSNNIVLDVDGNVQCLSCHRIHYADSNSLTDSADLK